MNVLESSRTLVRPLLALACASVISAVALPGPAAADVLDDADHRRTAAKFIRNFGKYVEWPDTAFANASAPIKVCALGAAPFESELTEELAGKSARDREFAYTQIDPTDLGAAASCNILFIHTDSAENASPVISALDGKPVLTVGAVEGFAQTGGMIGLIEQNGRMNMQINKTRLERNALKGSSRLYQIGN